MPTSLGPAEILVILVVALIVLGPNRLPEAGRQVGRAIAEIRRWTTDVTSDLKSAIDLEAPPERTVVEPTVVAGTVTSVAADHRPSTTEVVAMQTVETDEPALTVPTEAESPAPTAAPAAPPESPPGDPALP